MTYLFASLFAVFFCLWFIEREERKWYKKMYDEYVIVCNGYKKITDRLEADYNKILADLLKTQNKS